MTRQTFPILLSLLAITTSEPGHVLAATTPNDCGCHWALAKDVSTTIHTETEQLRFLQIIDQHTYEEAKSRGGFSLGLPIADDLLAISANWNDFRQKRQDYFSKVSYSLDKSLSDLEHFEVTSPLAYAAWSECMRACATAGVGLFAWKEKEDEDAIVVHVRYKVTASDKNQHIRLQGTVKRGPTAQKALFPASAVINNEETVPIIVDRRESPQTPTSPLLLSFKAGLYASTLSSTWTPAPPPPEYKPTVTHEQSACGGHRTEAADDGLTPIYGDKHRFSIHCSALGTITRVDVVSFNEGAGCPWIVRFKDDPADYIGPRDAYIRFWTNSSDDCIIRATVHYDLTSATCVAGNCPGKIPLPSTVLHANYMQFVASH